MTQITVKRRFHGPADSGNGGYSAGLLATTLGDGAAVEVTLRMPPPLDVPMDVIPTSDGSADLSWQGHLIAQARRTTLDSCTVPEVSVAAAAAAESSYSGLIEHPFPGCFSCGPERSPEDALRLFPGPVSEGLVACTWTVQPWGVDPACLWAALDCPSGWATGLEGRPAVLGRLTAQVLALPASGEQCVVVGQGLGREGRKAFGASAVRGVDGRVLAHARAVWIEVDPTTIRPPTAD